MNSFICYRSLALALICLALFGCNSISHLGVNGLFSHGSKPIKVLIVDGQNNHAQWPMLTQKLGQWLTDTQDFEVDFARTETVWRATHYSDEYALKDGKTYKQGEPVTDSSFSPDFEQYDVVISNFGWRAAPWPEATKLNFEQYMKNGGGLVVLHAADNSFPKWQEFNRMIGLGGWGGRNEKSGPYVYYSNEGKLIRDETPGHGGGHGKQHEFEINHRNDIHPITKGLVLNWQHTQDELYNRLRGPAENMTVLATAFDSPEFGGTGRHEPVLMAIDYYQGRVFHSTLGHSLSAYKSVGFKATTLRGIEWAATGQVRQEIPRELAKLPVN